MFKIRRLLLGKPRDPMKKDTRKHIALIAFLAWIGLGADGLSSSSSGPEQAFYALGPHTHLALYLAILTAITVFLISFAYNQVIKLFPNGGGGYKVASQLIGPHAGLVSGAALIIDYILTIAISIAAGADAVFSLLPPVYQPFKLVAEPVILILLLVSNLRGAKESIKILMVIFLGFFVTHIVVIVVGIIMHESKFTTVVHRSIYETAHHIKIYGWFFVLALFMRAYSLGAGTYTGLEAVSNNVNILAEPRVKTGSLTMLYMAISLSLVAGGIILLYLLWNVHQMEIVMTKTDTLSKDLIVKETSEFIQERFPAFNGVDVDGETPLLDNGEIDSLGILDLMNFLEERFSIEMTDDDFLPDYFESLNTLSELVISKA